MDESNFIPFEKFYNTDKNTAEERTVEDILLEVKEILNKNRGRWEQ